MHSRIQGSFIWLLWMRLKWNRLFCLKIKSASGYDDINPMLLKTSINHISVTLSHICNLPLAEGVLPDGLKLASVVPLFKADDLVIFDSCRPVSILCVISKVFEKIMLNRLQKYLNAFKFFTEASSVSSETTIPLIWHILYLWIQLLMNWKMENVSLDYISRFLESLWYCKSRYLLGQLDQYGIRGNALSWLKSYLTNRHQFVAYDNIKSENAEKIISYGVPQGSILGSLLFLIFINNLANVCMQTLPI